MEKSCDYSTRKEITTYQSSLHIMLVWGSGASYELYIGRWSRLVAKQFVKWLNVSSNSQWLDIGCGTGIIIGTILYTVSPRTVLGIDSSIDYLEFARNEIQDSRAAFYLGDAQALPVKSAIYDAVVSGLVLNFVPKPIQMLREMIRAVRIEGTIGAYVWDYAGQMQLIRYFWDAAVALEGQAAFDLDEGQRFSLCQPEPLRQLFQTVQLEDIQVHKIDIHTTFSDFDDYWYPFLGGQGPAPSYTKSLSEELRTALRKNLRYTLPISIDGTIHLVARAWAVRGVRKK